MSKRGKLLKRFKAFCEIQAEQAKELNAIVLELLDLPKEDVEWVSGKLIKSEEFKRVPTQEELHKQIKLKIKPEEDDLPF